MATLEEQFAQRQAEAQNTYDTRQAENKALYDQRQAEAQNQYNQRNAEAQATYDARLAESQGKITDMYDKALAAQNQQYQTALDQGIAAQEEARAGIAKSYQTASNDLAVQYERNRRNLNAQALARGLNTGTGSQQQLALNQGYMKSYGQLRGEESAQNAGIDRAIANLKVDYQNNVAQALANNDYQRAAALLDDYNNKLGWLDTQKMNNQNRLDTLNDTNTSRLDSLKLNNQNTLDSMRASNQNWYDSRTISDAQTMASYGDFSGYAALYGQEQADAMRAMWIAQNPLLAYNTGAISANRYFEMTGEYPPGVAAQMAQNSGGGGGGGGGYYYPSVADDEGKDDDKVTNSVFKGITAEDVGWRNTEKKLGLSDTSHAVRVNGRAQTAGEAGWNDTAAMIKKISGK